METWRVETWAIYLGPLTDTARLDFCRHHFCMERIQPRAAARANYPLCLALRKVPTQHSARAATSRGSCDGTHPATDSAAPHPGVGSTGSAARPCPTNVSTASYGTGSGWARTGLVLMSSTTRTPHGFARLGRSQGLDFCLLQLCFGPGFNLGPAKDVALLLVHGGVMRG